MCIAHKKTVSACDDGLFYANNAETSESRYSMKLVLKWISNEVDPKKILKGVFLHLKKKFSKIPKKGSGRVEVLPERWTFFLALHHRVIVLLCVSCPGANEFSAI